MKNFRQLNNEFRGWLKALGFADTSVNSLPAYVSELLSWLEENNIQKVDTITEATIKTFFLQWKNRKNKTRGGGLSQNHINKGVLALNTFAKFLRATGKNPIRLKLEREEVPDKIPEVLSLKEIHALYEATFNLEGRINTEVYGQRDRAILAVFYGCGLRRNEGINLEVRDIFLEKELLLVRKGKGNKERYVPISAKTLEDIKEYLEHGRKWFLEPRQKTVTTPTDAFFVSYYGKPLKTFGNRLQTLKELAGIKKEFSLHTLRHSIATHLLKSGMDIEQIQKFLGHSSLESTQIYTHVANEL